MSDELIVCITILILSAITAAILIIYLCALLAVTKAEDYQKNEGGHYTRSGRSAPGSTGRYSSGQII